MRLMSISWVPSGQPGRFFFCSPMLKQLFDRLSFALLGFIFGSLLAVLLWVLYGHGFSLRHAARREWGELSLWIRYVGGGFALLGFLLTDRVGDVVGSTTREVYEYESRYFVPTEVPTWLAIPVLVGVGLGVWHFLG